MKKVFLVQSVNTITLIIEYFQDGVVWKPRYDITSAVSFFKKLAELRQNHIWFTIKLAE